MAIRRGVAASARSAVGPRPPRTLGPRAVLAGALVASALVVVSCGEGSNDTSTTDSISSSSAPSSPSATAAGRVTDADGRPVASAIVDVEPLEGQSIGSIESIRRTDQDGRYVVVLPPGRWALIVSADGFDLARVELDVVADATTSGDIVLTRR